MAIKTDTYLRRADRADLDTVVAWMEEPDFQYFLYGEPSRAPQQLREQIVKMLGRTAGHTMPGGIYMMIDSPTAGPLGLISLQNISWRNRSCSIDLYIARKEYRRGLVATIAVYRTLEYCFHELNMHRVGAYVYAFNTASWRVFELSGAQRELVLRDHIVRDGVSHDLYGYGLLREEFDALRAAHGARAESISLERMAEALERQLGSS
ncbi:MAG: GNAT family N-acetyltransferase [Candidatus Hydrogenedentes bacterium]|nr:GNAT family N-acetyltransferase [Candidatus Hydrogenedentota bacterium]